MSAVDEMRALQDRRHAAAVAQVADEGAAVARLREYVRAANLAGLPGATRETSLTVAELRALLRRIDEAASR